MPHNGHDTVYGYLVGCCKMDKLLALSSASWTIDSLLFLMFLLWLKERYKLKPIFFVKLEGTKISFTSFVVCVLVE